MGQKASLVGGFNPFEKNSQMGSFPQVGVTSQPEGTKGDSLYTTTAPPKDSVLDLAKCLGMEGYSYNIL